MLILQAGRSVNVRSMSVEMDEVSSEFVALLNDYSYYISHKNIERYAHLIIPLSIRESLGQGGPKQRAHLLRDTVHWELCFQCYDVPSMGVWDDIWRFFRLTHVSIG